MREDCGCCEGIERVTPVSNENRPGLSALVYRAGTHATFLETMLARLTTQQLPAPVGDEVQSEGPRPLLALKTRDADDASVGFLDAWATVADVLTFYQERIANEGYLRTATERRSVTELANLVGYRPRPGVSASAHLAYTLEEKGEVTILAGSKAASTPGPGELPQTFETAEDLYARAEWNVFTPRLTRPQSHLVRPKTPIEVVNPIQRPLYLKGTATNLKPNDPVLIDYDGKAGGQQLFRVMKVEPDNEAKRTKVTLEPWVALPPLPAPPTPIPPPGPPFNKRAADIMKRYRDAEAFDVNPNTATAGRIIGQLESYETLLRDVKWDTKKPEDVSKEVRQYLEETALPPLREEHRLAREGNFTKLEPWIGGLVSELTDLSNQIAEEAAAAAASVNSSGTGGGTGGGVGGGGSIQPLALTLHSSSSSSGSSAMFTTSQASKLTATTTANKAAIGQVLPLLGGLTKPPSTPPRSVQQLPNKSIAQAFSPASDNLPRLLGAFKPGASAALYKAWEALPVTQTTPAKVYALRTRASLFGNSAPLFQDRNTDGTPKGDPQEWTLIRTGRKVQETRRFRVSVIYSTANDEFHTLIYMARVDLMNSSGVFTSTASIMRAIEDTTTPLTFTLPEPVTLTISGATSTDMQRITYTFSFAALKAEVTMRHDRERNSFHVSSTGNNPFDINYDPVTAQNPSSISTPAMMATCSVSVLSASTEFTEKPQVVNLDATYNKILPGGWVVIEKRPLRLDDTTHLPVQPIITRALRVGERSRVDYGMTAKGTELELYGVWIDPANELFENAVRKTSVYTESEQLELADETIDPVREDVCGTSVELGVLVAGLEAGRFMIITGERTDITVATKDGTSEGFRDVVAALEGANSDTSGATGAGGNASTTGGSTTTGDADKGDKKKVEPLGGIIASELVMLAGVEQSFDPKLPGDKTHTTLTFSTELAYCYKRDTVRIYGNVVRATHGETRAEVLGSGDASKAMQSFTLKQSPLTYVSAPTASGIESTLKVRVNDILWHETDTLAGLTPLDREYVTKADEAGATTVVFGNGREGARIPTGNENVRAVYRSGIGKGGNLKAKQINQPTTKPLGVKEVVNPLAATGGADRESRDEARRNAPLAVMALDRLVSVRDYEDFSRTFAGVAKASATRLSDGRRRVVHVTIAGADDVPISPTSDLYLNLREALHKYGDPHQPIELATRHLKTLFVSANVKVHPDYLWESVEPKVRAALLERFSFYRRDLGQDALLSEAIAAAQGVEGVVYVDFDIFDDVGEGTDPSLLLRLGEGLGLRRRVHAYLAHVESAAIVEDKSRIRPAQLVLLTPLVPDTLILKEKKKR
jgi:hypothetical protein